MASALLPMAEQIDSACIFGSVAQGRETTHNDVDVLVRIAAGRASQKNLAQLMGESGAPRGDYLPV